MIKTVFARECICDKCGFAWLVALDVEPTWCRKCRSREWNGTKVRRTSGPKPKLVLPKPPKLRRSSGGGDETITDT